ncbi:MAG: hypothetical protein ACJ72Y_06700 [Actinomycetes bacterium]
MSSDGPFFKTGFSSDGALHATLTYWGSALCSEPLHVVLDRHHYTADELDQIALCRDCSAVASAASQAPITGSRTLPT